MLTFKDLQRLLPSVEQFQDIFENNNELISIMTLAFGQCFDVKKKGKSLSQKTQQCFLCNEDKLKYFKGLSLGNKDKMPIRVSMRLIPLKLDYSSKEEKYKG